MNVKPENFVCRECSGSGMRRVNGFHVGDCFECEGSGVNRFRYKQALADKAVDEAWEKNR